MALRTKPVEQILSLRAIPGFIVLRPADANEVAEAWRLVLQLKHEPAALALSRPGFADIDAPNMPPLPV